MVRATLLPGLKSVAALPPHQPHLWLGLCLVTWGRSPALSQRESINSKVNTGHGQRTAGKTLANPLFRLQFRC